MLYECVCALLAAEDVLLLEAAADVDAEPSVRLRHLQRPYGEPYL